MKEYAEPLAQLQNRRLPTDAIETHAHAQHGKELRPCFAKIHVATSQSDRTTRAHGADAYVKCFLAAQDQRSRRGSCATD